MSFTAYRIVTMNPDGSIRGTLSRVQSEGDAIKSLYRWHEFADQLNLPNLKMLTEEEFQRAIKRRIH
jgi:hypothetical protein